MTFPCDEHNDEDDNGDDDDNDEVVLPLAALAGQSAKFGKWVGASDLIVVIIQQLHQSTIIMSIDSEISS